ncbi:MAG: hypothetical protein GX424_09325 [Clostridiales bacterium]|nr:hypothetical protein [Clostridiales bacterium]
MTKHLACELSACTGLRIGNVLNLPRFLFQNRKPAGRASSFQDEARSLEKTTQRRLLRLKPAQCPENLCRNGISPNRQFAASERIAEPQ